MFTKILGWCFTLLILPFALFFPSATYLTSQIQLDVTPSVINEPETTDTSVYKRLNTSIIAAENDREIIEGWFVEGLTVLQGLPNSLQSQSVPLHIEVLIEFYAQKHLGITYVGGLLEVPPVETLVVSLEGSDCVLFVEQTLAMAFTTLQQSTSYDDFESNLALIRYGDGVIDGYASRLHYFSDWLRTNQEHGRIELLFQQENLPELSALNFMSSNRDSYRQLTASDSLFGLIQLRERELNGMPPLRYIPQEDIPEFENQFRTGDLLSFVTTINGLDISHTAVVKRDADRVGFYHASTTGSVILDPATIYEYTLNRRNVRGIILARPIGLQSVY
jgi:hypothetical protein